MGSGGARPSRDAARTACEGERACGRARRPAAICGWTGGGPSGLSLEGGAVRRGRPFPAPARRVLASSLRGRAARVRLRGGDAVSLAAPGPAGRLLRQRRAAGPGGGSAGGARPGEAA